MKWTELHGRLLGQVFERVLGRAEDGAMAFVRCLTPEVVGALGSEDAFAPRDWRVRLVADASDVDVRTITADEAVEMREAKGDATLLLVDTKRAGAGMDGIYSASREVDETSLFREARRLAGGEITRRHSATKRRYAEQAIREARGYGGAYAVSLWAEFDFLCHVAVTGSPGAHLGSLGLWFIWDSEESNPREDLETARLFVDCLLGTTSAHLPPAARIEALKLDKASERDADKLERFLHTVDTKPLLMALGDLVGKEHLWVGALRTQRPDAVDPEHPAPAMAKRNGTVAKWSGLTESNDANEPPALILKTDADRGGPHSRLGVRWRTDPPNLEKNAVHYRVAVLTDKDESLCEEKIPHSARKSGEKCWFSDDDFSLLSEDSLLGAKVCVSVVGVDAIEAQESEEFLIRFGQPPEQEAGGVGVKVRTFGEGLVELESREAVSEAMPGPGRRPTPDSKGFLLLRTPVHKGRRKSFRVFRPPLIAEVEKQWIDQQGEIGRWVVRVRGSGERAGIAEFQALDGHSTGKRGDAWKRAVEASRGMAGRFVDGGGVGQVYNDEVPSFAIVREYLLAWAALLEIGDPLLAVANTVEVRSPSGHAIGLIVLPVHPLRVAWLAAYDNLVLHAAFEQRQGPKSIRDEFANLDGAMFPAFLPNPHSGAFVFADTLGFHAIGMVPDIDKEPKAAVAILARALGIASRRTPRRRLAVKAPGCWETRSSST